MRCSTAASYCTDLVQPHITRCHLDHICTPLAKIADMHWRVTGGQTQALRGARQRDSVLAGELVLTVHACRQKLPAPWLHPAADLQV
jgi:hypothetical protein